MFCSKTINFTGVTIVNTFQGIYNMKGLISIDSLTMELNVLVTEVFYSTCLTLFNTLLTNYNQHSKQNLKCYFLHSSRCVICAYYF